MIPDRFEKILPTECDTDQTLLSRLHFPPCRTRRDPSH